LYDFFNIILVILHVKIKLHIFKKSSLGEKVMQYTTVYLC